LHSSFQFSS